MKFLTAVFSETDIYRWNTKMKDRFFAGFNPMATILAEEKEPVVFGITEPINSVNPVLVFIHGYTRFLRQMALADKWQTRLALLVKPSDWEL